MLGHLKKLQEIADANGGTRALGSPGYAASVDYVANTLKDKGFDVKTDEFDVRLPFADEPAVTVGGQRVKAAPLLFTIGTPPDGVSGRLVPAREDDTPGCTATDYDGLDVSGAVVLVDRGKCPFSEKAAAAAQRGAVAVIVANNDDRDPARRHAGRADRRQDPRRRHQQGRRAPGCGRTRATPRSSSTQACGPNTPATSSLRPRPGRRTTS